LGQAVGAVLVALGANLGAHFRLHELADHQLDGGPDEILRRGFPLAQNVEKCHLVLGHRALLSGFE
jgi:hypothetical protein